VITIGDPADAVLGVTATMIGPRNWVVVVATVARGVVTGATVVVVAVVLVVLVLAMFVVVVGAAVVDVVLVLLVAIGVAVAAEAGLVGNANGVAVSATVDGVQPVIVTVPPSAAAVDVPGHSNHATPPAMSAVTMPTPTIVLRCSSFSPCRRCRST
jgi:hypothetical protein